MRTWPPRWGDERGRSASPSSVSHGWRRRSIACSDGSRRRPGPGDQDDARAPSHHARVAMAPPPKVLITGIGGYVGSSIASRLAGGCELIGAGRATKFALVREVVGERLRLAGCEVTDRRALSRIAGGADVLI